MTVDAQTFHEACRCHCQSAETRNRHHGRGRPGFESEEPSLDQLHFHDAGGPTVRRQLVPWCSDE